MNNIISKNEAERAISPLQTLTWDQVTGNGWKQLMYVGDILQVDIDTVYYTLNTWFYMFQDMTGIDARVAKTYYIPMNIFQICEDAEKTKEVIVRNLDKGYPLSYEVPYYHPVSYLINRFENTQDVDKIITFLSYTKRLPLRGLNSEGLLCNKFIKNNDRLAAIDWNTPSRTLITSELSHIMYCMLYGIKPDYSVLVLPPHQYLENVGKPYTYGGKFAALSRYASSLPTGIDKYFVTRGTSEIPDYNLFMAVPKNYKTGRSICIESIAKSYMGYTLSEPLTRRATSGIHGDYLTLVNPNTREKRYAPIFGCYYNYQAANQNLAWYGSITNDLVTRDLTAASDSLSIELARRVFPINIFNFCMTWRSPYCKLPTKKETMLETATLMTMGHSLTYSLQSWLFYGCEVLAGCWTEGINVFGLRPSKHLQDLPRTAAFVYNSAVGDDMIHHRCISDALDFILDQIGFVTNPEKTFVDGHYRESCGKEYYNGTDVTGLYYPRGTSTNKYAELIGIQHKLVGYPLANAFIIDCIRNIFPSVTYSYADSPYTDIWTLDAKDTGEKKEFLNVKYHKPRIFVSSHRKTAVERLLLTVASKCVCPLAEIEKLDLWVHFIDGFGHRIKSSSEDVRGMQVSCYQGKSAFNRTFTYIPYIGDIKEIFNLAYNQCMEMNGGIDYMCDMKLTLQVPSKDDLLRLTQDVRYTEHESQNSYVTHTSVIAKPESVLPGQKEYNENACYALLLSKTKTSESGLPWLSGHIDYSIDIRNQVSQTTESVVENKEYLF